MKHRFSSIEQAVQAISKGRIVIVVDSEDREDEGDFLAAAEFVTPQTIHFMISHGRGQLCMPVMPAVAEQLQLTPMVQSNGDLTQPKFAVPVDHRTCRTGISPAERTITIKAIIDGDSKSDDFVRPGHIFPLIAQPEGVLKRSGHTESAVDLAMLAGLTPAGILCEICSRDGVHMANHAELFEIADMFQLAIVTIDSLIEFRRKQSTLRRNGVNGVPGLHLSRTARLSAKLHKPRRRVGKTER